LRSLPFKEADRIVTLWERNSKEGIERDDVSPANFLDWRDRQQVFAELAFANPFSFDYSGSGEPEVIQAALVSKNFFQILGVNALHGRTFLPEEYEQGKDQVVLLS
jgi:putative ABC transport system permease protein